MPHPLIQDPERSLALAYAPARLRPALALLWRLDEQLGAIVARADNPAIAQMRLTWWHDALRTARIVRPVDPLLVEIAKERAIDPQKLLPLIDGWEELLEPLPLSDEALARYAEARGATLFMQASAILARPERSRGAAAPNVRPSTTLGTSGEAGALWALVDLAFRVSDPVTAQRALALAPEVRGALPRPLAMLAALARHDHRRGLDLPRRQGSPSRVLRALAAGVTGL